MTPWLMAERIENLYRDLARAAIDRMPRVTELIETEGWRGFIGEVGALDKSSVDAHTGLRDPHKQFDTLRRSLAPKNRRAQPAFSFFTRRRRRASSSSRRARTIARIETRWREHRKTDLPKPEDISETIDFHKIVAAMGSYPTLLRRLGLVVDLVLAPGGFAPAAAADLSVKVLFPAGALQIARTKDGAPATRTRLSATRFDAVPDPAQTTPSRTACSRSTPPGFACCRSTSMAPA